MPSFQIPTKDKKFIQTNKSDLFGNLFSTWNLDFDSSQGKVKVSSGMMVRTNSTDDADLGNPMAFVRSSADGTDRWWALCGAVLFKNTAGASPISSAFVQDAIASSPTTLTAISSDMVDFNGALIVSTSTELYRLSTTWNATWWTGTLAQSALTASIAHPLHVSIKTNNLLIGDGNKLHTVDINSNVRSSRVILPTEFEIIWIRSSYDGVWVGARNKFMRDAQVFYWDESAENYNRGYGLKHFMTFAGIIKNGICHTINGVGQLLKFNGSGFEEVAVLPIFNQINKRWTDGNSVLRNICRNGMDIIQDKIHINVCSEINNALASFMGNFPGGIWVYDEQQGLRHKYGISQFNISSFGTSGQEVDYGAMRIDAAGAIVQIDANSGVLLAGATITTNATTTLNVISFVEQNQSVDNRGHFVSSVFESSSFEDIYKEILLSFKRFRNSGDRIIIKYKNNKSTNYPVAAAITWSDTNTFTTTTDIPNAVVGDEVMVIKGKGSGATAHISAISAAGGTYTVDLDESITGVTGTAQVIINNFKKAATISTQGIDRESFDLDVPGTFLQLKVELRTKPAGVSGFGDTPELEKIIVNSSTDEVI